MMVQTAPYSDQAAMAILSRLDPWDLLEVETGAGTHLDHLGLFALWRALLPGCFDCLVIADRGEPFALLAILRTGAHGVGSAALIARDHIRFRRGMVRLARMIAARIAVWAAEHGLCRIEVRSWERHPRAAAFLTACGFTLEATLAGFGRDGADRFLQFAWVAAPTAERGT